ncbi:retrovirus-related pol polyprotein from transposon TNT 1-94 [Tanacetum coccineum]
MPEAHQPQLTELTAQLSALGFQVSPIAPSGPQAFYGVRPSNNNRNNDNNNHGNRNNSRGNNNNDVELGSAFALKDLRPLNYFLGIETVVHVSDVLLSQKKYILELLQSVGLSNCNPMSSLYLELTQFR